MIISDIQLRSTSEGSKLSARVTFESSPGLEREVWFCSEPGCPDLEFSGDPFFAGFIIPAMSLGERLHIEALVSTELIDTFIHKVMPILLRWNPDFQIPQIETAGQFSRTGSADAGAASTFSGGLDSWHTFLKNREDITHLLHCVGFDRPRASTSRIYEREIRELTREQARRSGKVFLGLSTNLTDVGNHGVATARARTGRQVDPHFQISWYYTSQLVSFALAYGPLLGKLYIAGSFPYEQIRNKASNPLTDPAWSTPLLQVIHDGAEVTRTGKMKLILGVDPEALQSLHVCHAQRQRGDNCNHCEKCLRTRVSLELIGYLGSCKALASPLDLTEIRMLDASKDPTWWENLREEALELRRPDIAQAIEVALGRRWDSGRFLEDLRKWTRLYRTPHGRKQIQRRIKGAIDDRRSRILNSI